jgi:lipoprotein-anchoring transpeptidase ErfK/SrfK
VNVRWVVCRVAADGIPKSKNPSRAQRRVVRSRLGVNESLILMSEPESHLRRQDISGPKASSRLRRLVRLAVAGLALALFLGPVVVVTYRISVPTSVSAVSETPPSTAPTLNRESPSNEPLSTQQTQPWASDFDSAGFQSPIKVAPSSLIATLTGPTPAYADPTTPTVLETIPASWSGATLALPVVAKQGQRAEVRLLQRPNGGTAWIALASASLTYTPYHLYVDLSTNRLLLYNASKLVLRAPAGLGAPQTPTPTGSYFVALFAQSPSPGYGPFVIVTSAVADTITDWEQDGNPMVAITGPLDTEAAIVAGGGAVSRGCIRLLAADLSRLRNVPAGTPVDVVASLRAPATNKTKTSPSHALGSPTHPTAFAVLGSSGAVTG